MVHPASAPLELVTVAAICAGKLSLVIELAVEAADVATMKWIKDQALGLLQDDEGLGRRT